MRPTSRHQNVGRAGRRGQDAHRSTKTRLIAPSRTGRGRSPAPPAATCLLFTAPEVGTGAKEGGAIPTAGWEEAGGVAAKGWFQFGSLPRIYAAAVHVSRSLAKGKRFLLRAASLEVCVRLRDRNPELVPGDFASGAAVRALGAGAAVGRAAGPGSWVQAAVKTQGKGRVPGRIGMGRWQGGLRRVPRPGRGRRGHGRPHTTSCLPWQRRQQP